MRCAESLRVQAYFDGELDALSAVEVERHSEHCAECGALLQDLGQVRRALRQDLTHPSTPPPLRARILRSLAEEPAVVTSRRTVQGRGGRRLPPFWKGLLSGLGGAVIAASLGFLLLAPTVDSLLPDELLDAHVRSLMPAHLIDVVSTERHTVKPWFAGHADVSPVVADFAQEGYRLLGGRADYFDHQRAAVVVYQHGAHLINVFSWAATARGLPKSTTRNGYHMVFWQTGNLAYCAVSDTASDELQRLVQLLQEMSAHEKND